MKFELSVVQLGSTDCKDKDNGPLARYVKLWVAHAPGMPETFSPPPTSK